MLGSGSIFLFYIIYIFKLNLSKPEYYRIEKRVEERKRKWEEDVENELKQQREATRFKARPARVLEEESFVSFICNVVTRFH